LNVIFICNPFAIIRSNLSTVRGKRVEKCRFLKQFLADAGPDSAVRRRVALLQNYHIAERDAYHWFQLGIARTRAAKRDTFRLAVFLCMMPFCAVRASTGSAAVSASWAALFWPEAIASSTFLTSVRIRVRRALLTSVRLAVLRTAFLADVVFAISFDPL